MTWDATRRAKALQSLVGYGVHGIGSTVTPLDIVARRRNNEGLYRRLPRRLLCAREAVPLVQKHQYVPSRLCLWCGDTHPK